MRVGPYEVVRRLGAGGMGVVYLAHAPGGEPVAVKVMNIDWVDQPGFPVRFEREVEAIRRVAPFCTAPVLDAAITEDAAYIVTEYVEGRTLWETVKERGPLRGGRLESVAVGIGVALTAIHRAGIVHRDLKPGNVILSPEGTRVIDFGVAKLAHTVPITGNVAVGTPPFMSPEQASGEPVSPASDVFSWGSVITFAATGEAPFGTASGPEVFYRVVHEEPRLEGVPERLAKLVARALDKDPGRRPEAPELVDALIGRGVDVATATDITRQGWMETLPPEPRKTRRRLSRPVIAAVAGVCVAASAGAGYLMMPRSDPPDAAFTDEFDDKRGWVERTGDDGAARYFEGGYLLQLPPGQGVVSPAPVRSDEMGDVRVTAKARVQAGTATYGIWCGGNPVRQPDNRYSLYLNGTGTAGITKQAQGGTRTELRPPQAVSGVSASAENVVEAECRFSGGQARLRLSVNGRLAAEAIDRNRPYGPGSCGVEALTATDATETATVRYESFSARRLPR